MLEESQVHDYGTQRNGFASVKVIGIGGGGCNAVARMYRERLPSVEYVAVNTDAQHLVRSDIPMKIQVGDKLTRGLGVGGNPELGRDSAEESRRRAVRSPPGRRYGIHRLRDGWWHRHRGLPCRGGDRARNGGAHHCRGY